jgi:hypothetical protein
MLRATRSTPTPSEVNAALPASSMPAMAITTVAPEISTAWPEVAAARCSALRGGSPAAVSSRSRRR